MLMTTKRALITGVTGQDGAYLAEFLLAKGYEVHGIKRRSSSFNTARIDHLYQDPHEAVLRFRLHHGDLTDATNLIRIVQEVQPDEIYNLGAQSHVAVSFETAEYTADADAMGTLRLLEAVRILGLQDRVRFYQAGSSEMFGKVHETPQRETTPFHPRSPYGAAKVYAYWITVNYRESYGMFAANGILFNHESPRRGETFVSRKITRGLARIRVGLQTTPLPRQPRRAPRLGLRARLRRGAVADAAAAKPADYVIATGRQIRCANSRCSRPSASACACSSAAPASASRASMPRRAGLSSVSTRAISARPRSRRCGRRDQGPRRPRLDRDVSVEDLVEEMVEPRSRLAERERR